MPSSPVGYELRKASDGAEAAQPAEGGAWPPPSRPPKQLPRGACACTRAHEGRELTRASNGRHSDLGRQRCPASRPTASRAGSLLVLARAAIFKQAAPSKGKASRHLGYVLFFCSPHLRAANAAGGGGVEVAEGHGSAPALEEEERLGGELWAGGGAGCAAQQLVDAWSGREHRRERWVSERGSLCFVRPALPAALL